MYNDFEYSLDNASPVELYLITQFTRTWCLTSYHEDITYNNQVYQSCQIDRGKISQSKDILKDGLDITLPITHSLSKQFIQDMNDDNTTTITLFRGHIDDPDKQFIVYWKGRLMATSPQGSKVTFSCESVFTSIQRPGLRAKYERTCRHPLYSSQCGLVKEAYRQSAIVTSISSDKRRIVYGGAGAGSGYFIGGVIENNLNGRRLVLEHDGSGVVVINRPFNNLSIGDNIYLYPGCSHTWFECIGKFGNQLNFGGFPFIPDKNPFGGINIFI